MIQHQVRDKDGRKVKEGDHIVSCRRGSSGVFIKVVRGVEYNGEARILVIVSGYNEFSEEAEFSASTFGLEVITLCGVAACREPDRHSTRDHGAELRIGA